MSCWHLPPQHPLSSLFNMWSFILFYIFYKNERHHRYSKRFSFVTTSLIKDDISILYKLDIYLSCLNKNCKFFSLVIDSNAILDRVLLFNLIFFSLYLKFLVSNILLESSREYELIKLIAIFFFLIKIIVRMEEIKVYYLSGQV